MFIFTIITIKSISTFERHSIISLFFLCLSSKKIVSQISLWKSTVFQVLQEIQLDKPRLHGGHPSKLTSTNKRAIVQYIIAGKANNAVQATVMPQACTSINHY
ncbi:hypothetical protein ID866_8647 [Astraeus odoratus]|nr:hypothetical protein ID866_8647 [Astraeus odoratus]